MNAIDEKEFNGGDKWPNILRTFEQGTLDVMTAAIQPNYATSSLIVCMYYVVVAALKFRNQKTALWEC